MTASLAGLRYPSSRVLLPRTRLAYIHLRNLLSDAKRDRAARVSAYVAIWLPDELVTLFLRTGEVVNATINDDTGSRAIAISEALGHGPSEPEYGEICFHEAPEEQLAAMFVSQSQGDEPWPGGFTVTDPAQLFPYLMSTMFDGTVEIVCGESVNYLLFRHGAVERAFVGGGAGGSAVDRVASLFQKDRSELQLRRWAGVPELPVQAPPALVQAYRDLTTNLVGKLVEAGRGSASAIAEHARQNLLTAHPSLDAFSFTGRPPRESIASTDELTAAVGSMVKEILWATADHEGAPPESMLKELTWDRRHMFQSAGFYDWLPWKVM